MNKKRMYKSSTDKQVMGVCGGLGEYLNLDPTLIRVLFLILLFAGSSGFWIYIIMGVVLPYDYQIDGHVQRKPENTRFESMKSERKDITPEDSEGNWGDF